MSKIVQRDAAELAGHPPKFRRIETFFVLVYPIVVAWHAYRAFPAMRAWPLLVPIAIVLGLLVADFISGFMHWLFDTWGTPDLRVVGPLWIRTFREHHVDQTAITRHDFIETNGSNFLGATSMSISHLVCGEVLASKTNGFCVVSLLFASIFLAMTSQIHKWAHMKTPPRFVAWLQRARLVLSPSHHAIHHGVPFDRHYCITCGWLNAVLSQTRFFTVLERIITACTGAVPRQDDIGTEAALEIADSDSDVVLPAPRKRVIDKNLT